MPETPMNEHNCVVFRKHEVRFPGQFRVVKPVSVPS